jgi:hypothetical protein
MKNESAEGNKSLLIPVKLSSLIGGKNSDSPGGSTHHHHNMTK